MAAAQRHSPAKSAAAQRAEGHITSASNGVDSIWKACAYGDYDKLCRYVEQQPELVNQVRESERDGASVTAAAVRNLCFCFRGLHSSDLKNGN